MKTLIDITIEKVDALRDGLDELEVLLNAARGTKTGSVPAKSPPPKQDAPPAKPASPPAAAKPAKPSPASEELTRRRIAVGPRSRGRQQWTDDEVLYLVDLIPTLPMKGPGSLSKRTSIIRKIALDTGRTETAVRAKINDVRREFHPDLVDKEQSERIRRAKPWAREEGRQ